MTHKTRNSIIITLLFTMSILLIATLDVFADSVQSATGKINYNGKLPVRASATTSSKKVMTLKNNTKVTILEEKFVSKNRYSNGYKWYKISYKGKVGYVKANRIKSIKYKSVTLKTKDYLNYRYGPGTSMKKKGTFGKNKKVTVVLRARPYGSKDVWYKVQVGKNYFYAKSSWFTEIKKTASTSDKSKKTAATTTTNTNSTMTNTNSNNSVTETVDPPKEEPTKPFDENSFEAYLTQQGFPDDYKAKLKELHKQYPSWVFIGRKTGFSFSQAVTKETRDGISLIHSAYPLSYRDKGSASYDSNTGKYIPKDGSVWFNANKSVVEYYMDPRNFLNEEKIYMFLDQSYQKYQSEMAVYKIIKDNALGKNGYQTEWFIEAGRKYEISPISLAIRASSEVGGGSIACSGKVIDGKKYYNPFNIGAYSGENPLSAGMEYAKKQGWDTKQKAIEGAAKMLSNSYLKNNQHTQYYQKFNVANGLSYVATYQYMTNIMAPYLEATYTKNTYSAYGITGEQLVFEIPIYTDMPSATKLP